MTGKPWTEQGVRTGNTAAFMAQRDPNADPLDFFPTPPWGARAGAELVRRFDPAARSAWECACGSGSMAHGAADYFPTLYRSDVCLYDRNVVFDFLADGPGPFGPVDWVFTNPPFEPAAEFVLKALERADRGVAMLLRPAFAETVGRYAMLNHGSAAVSVKAWFAERLPMTKGRWDPRKSSASAYQWFFWFKPAVRSPIAQAARRMRAQHGVALDFTIPPGTRDRLSRPSDLAFAMRSDDHASAARTGGGHG